MAIRPDYDIGTVTLVASSANFTTTGASLQTAAVQAGDAIITPSGHVLIIASITGQNSGTLFLPCPSGAAGTNLPIRIRFQPDGSRYQGAVRNLVDLLSSGNVEAFAALIGEDGLVPIFTGPGALDLVDPATFGIQDPNGSLGKLAGLALGNRQILQTDGTGALKTLALAARQILQTDDDGALKAIALAADKFLHTDENGDLALSDLGAAAIALLNLSGTAAADRLPYLTGAAGASLTALTAYARTILDDTSGAAMFATMGFSSGSGWFKLPSGHIVQWGTLSGTTDANGLIYVTLPTGYSSATAYNFVCWNGESGITAITSKFSNSGWPTSSAFAVRFRNPTTGAILTGAGNRVDWISVGL